MYGYVVCVLSGGEGGGGGGEEGGGGEAPTNSANHLEEGPSFMGSYRGTPPPPRHDGNFEGWGSVGRGLRGGE